MESHEQKKDRQYGLVWRISIGVGIVILALACGAVDVIEALRA